MSSRSPTSRPTSTTSRCVEFGSKVRKGHNSRPPYCDQSVRTRGHAYLFSASTGVDVAPTGEPVGRAKTLSSVALRSPRTTGQVQGPLGNPHRLKPCSSAAELLAGDAAADVEQMVLGVVQCVSDDGGRVDHLIFGVDSDHDLLFRCE